MDVRRWVIVREDAHSEAVDPEYSRHRRRIAYS